MDLPPMERCPYGRKGRHSLSYVIPSEYDYDLTMACDYCGAARRMPVTGSMLRERLDDLTAAEIEQAVRG